MDEVISLLDSFRPITLKEMEPVKLMDRVDKKFMLTLQLLPEILREIRNDYFVLDIAGKRTTRYQTIYFDTPRYDCYLKHHNGRLNRYKVRSRQYVESNLNFFEVKFKSNKDRTKKKRLLCEEQVRDIGRREHEYMQKFKGLNASGFQPSMFIDFTRITFVSKELNERLTIDMNLQFRNESGEKRYDRLVIIEAKMSSGKTVSSVVQALKKFKVSERSISKYCLGVAQLVPAIKKNKFKPALLYLNKLLTNERPVLQH
jgi:hypothetical protein